MKEIQNNINAVKSFFNWLESFLQKQWGIFLFILSIVGGGLYYGNLKYEEGIKNGKEINKDRVENLLSIRDEYKITILVLNRKVDSLEYVLSKVDVLGEAQKRLDQSRKFEEQMKQKYLTEKKDNNDLEKLVK